MAHWGGGLSRQKQTNKSIFSTSIPGVSFCAKCSCVDNEDEDRGSTVVKVLRYKLDDRWFDLSWCQ